MTNVVLSLGTNLGDRTAYMRQMEREVGALLEPPLTKSSLMETEPVGTASKQEWFYNRLVRGGYSGTSSELLKACHAIETLLGRTRPERYAARTADVDILLFGSEVIKEQDLILPHPGIQKRRFCILGLKEIAAEWVFPGTVKRIDEMAGEWEKDVEMQEVRLI